MATKQKKQTKSTRQDDNVTTITQSAYDTLKIELTNRVQVLRPAIAKEIADARELGDLSENHAYSVAMEKKDLNESRINELESLLAVAQIVQDTPSDNTVNIGDSAELQNLTTKSKRVITIVGSEESKSANPMEGKISIDSPIGRAISGKRVGEEVEVTLPVGVVRYKILKLVDTSTKTKKAA